MALISLFFFIANIYANDLPRFLVKHSLEAIRYISMDGRYAYVQKKPGVLGFVNSYKSIDFISEPNRNTFLVKSSPSKQRLIIESIPNIHDEMNLFSNHSIYLVDYGNTMTRKIGQGKNANLHLNDEWISFYNMTTRVIHIKNLITQKDYKIILGEKVNPFFIPEVEMISSQTLAYTDVNAEGFAALVSYDLLSLKSTIVYKSTQSGTKLELCQSGSYLAMGEFPYDGVDRGSKILTLPLSDSMNLSGFSTSYESVEQDLGNIVCLPSSIYFLKAFNQDKFLNHKVTEAVKLDIKTKSIEQRTHLRNVSQIIEMDGRVLVPFRGDFFVLEGQSNIGVDILQPVPNEELEIDI